MEKWKDSDERRRFVRADCLMRGKVVTMDAKKKIPGEVSAAFLKNISAGGVLFKDKRDYPVGQFLVVTVHSNAVKGLDKNLADVIKTREFVLGKVIRKEELPEGNGYEYGVCFVRNDEGLDYFSIFVQLINQIELKQ